MRMPSTTARPPLARRPPLRTLALAAALSVAAVPADGGSQPYGAGKPGAGGFVPILSAGSPNVGNSGFELRVDRVIGGSVSVFLLSVADAQIPFAGGDILVSLTAPNPILLVPLATNGPFGTPGEGHATLPLPLPSLPQLPGLEVYAQVLVDQTSAGAPGYALSQGLAVRFHEPPIVFVGCSIAGNSDPYQIVDPATGVTLSQGGGFETDNVTAAAWAPDGAGLFVASSLQSSVAYSDLAAYPAVFNTLYTSAGSGCYGLGLDGANDLLWTLTDPGSGSRELVALDGDPTSPGFGTVSHQTAGLAGGALIEPWALSPSGRFAAVLTIFPAGVLLVDTDPASPTFLQVLANQVMPTSGAPFTLANHAAFTPDDEFALIMVQNAGASAEIARFHVPSRTFWDHDPTTPFTVEHIGAFSQPQVLLPDTGTHIEVSRNGQFAVIGGFGVCGWMGRLDFDLTDPASFAYTQWSQGVGLSNSWRFDLAADGTRVAVTSWPDSGCSHVLPTPALSFVDVATGQITSSVAIPFNSNSNTLQNLYTVTFRE